MAHSMAKNPSHFNDSTAGAQIIKDCKPCFKHAAQNISRKSATVDSVPEDPLCKGCSDTVLSYIFLMQDMLDGLARKIHGGKDLDSCVQCLREESRHSEESFHENFLTNQSFKNSSRENLLISEEFCKSETIYSDNLKYDDKTHLNGISKDEYDGTPTNVDTESKFDSRVIQNLESCSKTLEKDTQEVITPPKRPRKLSSRRNSRRISRDIKENGNVTPSDTSANGNGWQTDFLYNVSPAFVPKFLTYAEKQKTETTQQVSATVFLKERSDSLENVLVKRNGLEDSNHRSLSISSDSSPNSPPLSLVNSPKSSLTDVPFFATSNDLSELSENRNRFEEIALNHSETEEYCFEKSEFSGTESSSENLESRVDEKDVFSSRTLNVATENIIQNTEKRKTLHDSFKGCDSAKDTCSEAFVTSCRNNFEALGCLVLGTSLLLGRTSRKLCVLISDDVDLEFKDLLSSIFHEVHYMRHLNSIDEDTLDYLKQNNLEKLNIWRLIQFSKCVFLNPDCLVLRNCDELFQHNELSAVPDIGWPDCFNAGVFIFIPSTHTFSELVKLSQEQGQNNGGDQILLNTYFDSWSSNISNKLSFIYNLMRNTSYTYTPAYQRFGQNVKIVQFLVASKPWQVKFFTRSGQIDESENVHLNHIQFISEWISIFKTAVLRLLPQVVYSYVLSQRTISAEDIVSLVHFPGGGENLCEKFESFHIIRDRKQPYSFTTKSKRDLKPNHFEGTLDKHSNIQLLQQSVQKLTAVNSSPENATEENEEKSAISSGTPTSNNLPGSSIGDYHGMMAWEQGQMDYEGIDSSENIINRLSFLIHQSV
ncbi:glycogenin-1 [Caerostris darwini]|uniref:glycogenin glucosyltransferase n=1 Tax=Caerostris darwini TaxID=1538125 RepID=A0AAV4RSA9_9ARAC|nr:glycogenin-1 [Caerostris darwini]